MHCNHCCLIFFRVYTKLTRCKKQIDDISAFTAAKQGMVNVLITFFLLGG